MPIQVPELGDTSQRPLSLPRAPSLGDGGLSSISRGVSQATDVLQDVQLRQAQERNVARIFEAETQLDNLYRQKEAEFRQRRGSAAFGLQDEATAWWDGEEPARIAAELDNDVQRTLFSRALAKRRGASLDALAAYEAGERHSATELAARSAVATQVSFAAQNYDSPAAVSAARDDVIQKVEVLGTLNGWDRNVLAAELRTNLTNLHRQVFENMLDANPAAANAYIEAHKNEIDGTIWDQLKKAADTGNEIKEAQRVADEAWASGKRGTALFDAIRGKAEGEVRERALAMAKARNAEVEQEQNTYKANLLDEAEAAFAQNGLAGITPSLESRMLRAGLGGALTSLRNRAWQPQDKVPTDWTTYEAVKNEINTLAERDLSTFRLTPYLDRLNSREVDALSQLIESRKKGLPDNVATTEQLLAEAHNAMGWGAGDAEAKGLFDRRVREAIDAEQRATGKELNDEQKRKVIDRMLIKGEVPRNWWLDRSAQFFEVVGTPDEANFRLDIPKAQRREIEAALKARNVAVDEATVQRYYRAYLDWQEGRE